jgi:hypothetical protein
MNPQMDAPLLTAPTNMLRPSPRNFVLRGDIALSLSLCQTDFEGAKALMDLILLCEPLNHVDLVLSIAGGPEVLDEREWYDFHAKATGFFRKVHINKTPDVRPLHTASADGQSRDWRPNNRMFRGVVDFFQHFMAYDLKRNTGCGAFYYLEPDCCILRRDWFSQLCGAYVTGRKPFMGMIRQSHKLDGSMLPRHMNGSGFYPNPVVTYSQALYVASTNQHPEAAPFDVAGGATVVPLCQPTKLICVDFTANPQINAEAVVWHGDKRNQAKYSMIEKFGGKVVQAARPHFPDVPSEHLEDRFTRGIAESFQSKGEALINTGKEDFLGNPEFENVVLPSMQAIHEHHNAPPRMLPPTNAYEAYLRALNAFGHDPISWTRAVKEFKAHREAAPAGKDAELRLLRYEEA